MGALNTAGIIIYRIVMIAMFVTVLSLDHRTVEECALVSVYNFLLYIQLIHLVYMCCLLLVDMNKSTNFILPILRVITITTILRVITITAILVTSIAFLINDPYVSQFVIVECSNSTKYPDQPWPVEWSQLITMAYLILIFIATIIKLIKLVASVPICMFANGNRRRSGSVDSYIGPGEEGYGTIYV